MLPVYLTYFGIIIFVYWRHIEAHYRMIHVEKYSPTYWLENIKRGLFIIVAGLVGAIIELKGHPYWIDWLKHSLVWYSVFVLTWDYLLNIRRDIHPFWQYHGTRSQWDKFANKIGWEAIMIFKVAFFIISVYFFYELKPV